MLQDEEAAVALSLGVSWLLCVAVTPARCCRQPRGMQAVPTSSALLLARVYSAERFPGMASPQCSLPALLTTDVRALMHKICREYCL